MVSKDVSARLEAKLDELAASEAKRAGTLKRVVIAGIVCVAIGAFGMHVLNPCECEAPTVFVPGTLGGPNS